MKDISKSCNFINAICFFPQSRQETLNSRTIRLYTNHYCILFPHCIEFPKSQVPTSNFKNSNKVKIRGHLNNTWHSEEGGRRSVTHTYLFLKTVFWTLLEGKLLVTKQDNALKDTFFQQHLIFQSNWGLQISHQKLKNVAAEGGGVEKCQKVSRII